MNTPELIENSVIWGEVLEGLQAKNLGQNSNPKSWQNLGKILVKFLFVRREI